jgi:KDO2-lipid IV(A) lauroyltransferase
LKAAVLQTRENKKKSIVSAPLRAKFIEVAFGVFRFLPRRAILPLSGFLAKCSSALNTRAFATTRTNLENCLPELAAEDRKQLALRSIREDWKTVLETLVLWNQGLDALQVDVRVVNVQPVLDVINARQPLIIAALHMGNWELAAHIGAKFCTGTVLYRPIKIQELNDFIIRRRQQPGWEYAPTNLKGVQLLFRRLKEGKTVLMFPDQEPVSSGGEYAEFFGVPALTSTLIPRLVSKTGAQVYYMVCWRQDDGFTLELYPSRLGSAEDNEGIATLNQEIEQIVRRRPEQYLWSYKRFKTPASGRNFYLK